MSDEKPAVTTADDGDVAPVDNPATDAVAAKPAVSDERDDAGGKGAKTSGSGSHRDSRQNGRDHDRRGGRNDARYNKAKPQRREDEFDLPETSNKAEALERLDFYFSDSNLASDEHLFYEMQGSKNVPISFAHIMSFKRMQRFKPWSAVREAIKESNVIELVDEGGRNEGIKRKTPLTIPSPHADKELSLDEEWYYKNKTHARDVIFSSVWAKGFAQDDSQVKIENLFKPYGALSVRKRFDDETGAFKGSVFVEFDSPESQKQFLELETKPTHWDGGALEFKSKQAYMTEKCEQKNLPVRDFHAEIRPYNPKFNSREARNGRGSFYGGGRGDTYRGSRGGRGSSHRDSGSSYRGDKKDFRARRDHDQGRDRQDRRGRNDRSRGRDRRDGRDDRGRRDRDNDVEKDGGVPINVNGIPVVQESKKRARDEPEAEAGSPKKAKVDESAAGADNSTQ